MSFKVGDKVACIEMFSGRDKNGVFWDIPMPIKDKIYCIAAIEDALGKIWLSFVELDHEAQYDSTFFRKLDYDFVEDVIEQIKKEPVCN